MLDHFGKGVKLIRSFMKKKLKKKKKKHILLYEDFMTKNQKHAKCINCMDDM